MAVFIFSVAAKMKQRPYKKEKLAGQNKRRRRKNKYTAGTNKCGFCREAAAGYFCPFFCSFFFSFFYGQKYGR